MAFEMRAATVQINLDDIITYSMEGFDEWSDEDQGFSKRMKLIVERQATAEEKQLFAQAESNTLVWLKELVGPTTTVSLDPTAAVAQPAGAPE